MLFINDYNSVIDSMCVCVCVCILIETYCMLIAFVCMYLGGVWLDGN